MHIGPTATRQPFGTPMPGCQAVPCLLSQARRPVKRESSCRLHSPSGIAPSDLKSGIA